MADFPVNVANREDQLVMKQMIEDIEVSVQSGGAIAGADGKNYKAVMGKAYVPAERVLLGSLTGPVAYFTEDWYVIRSTSNTATYTFVNRHNGLSFSISIGIFIGTSITPNGNQKNNYDNNGQCVQIGNFIHMIASQNNIAHVYSLDMSSLVSNPPVADVNVSSVVLSGSGPNHVIRKIGNQCFVFYDNLTAYRFDGNKILTPSDLILFKTSTSGTVGSTGILYIKNIVGADPTNQDLIYLIGMTSASVRYAIKYNYVTDTIISTTTPITSTSNLTTLLYEDDNVAIFGQYNQYKMNKQTGYFVAYNNPVNTALVSAMVVDVKEGETHYVMITSTLGISANGNTENCMSYIICYDDGRPTKYIGDVVADYSKIIQSNVSTAGTLGYDFFTKSLFHFDINGGKRFELADTIVGYKEVTQ